MSLADHLRRAAQYGRRRAQDVAQRTTTVALEVTVYSAAAGMAGATVSSTTTTTLAPNPKVERVSAGDPSYFLGGFAAAAGGDPAAPLWRVGPITKTHPGGGYAAADLLPTGGSDRTVRYRLTGDPFTSGGELHEVVAVEHETPQSLTLLVKRSPQ